LRKPTAVTAVVNYIEKNNIKEIKELFREGGILNDTIR
jgi:hypothetical protein